MEARNSRDTHRSSSFCYIATIFVCGLVQHTEHCLDAINILPTEKSGTQTTHNSASSKEDRISSLAGPTA